MNNQAALLFRSGPLAGKGRKIKKEITIIGRSSSCDICIADASISREHAKIIVEKGVFSIKDMGSHNGIKVNDSKLEQLILKNGTRFKLGTAEIEFWDGVGAPPATQQEFATPVQADTLPLDYVNTDKQIGSNKLDDLKQKRFTNIVILISIITMVLILGVSIFVLSNREERPVHYQFIQMVTGEDRVLDLSFKPQSESEKFLKPFIVHDYTSYTTTFKNILLDSDIFIVKANDIVAPTMSKVILIRTKLKTGQGEITFYIDKDDEKRKIGVLKIDVNRRQIPEVLEKNLNADLETKISIAEDLLQQALKYEHEANKTKEVWELLKNGKSLFENGEAKPEIYSKIDKKFSEMNKNIERTNKQLYSQYDLALEHSDFHSCANTLSKIILINPDDENLFKQKAVLYLRRVKALLK